MARMGCSICQDAEAIMYLHNIDSGDVAGLCSDCAPGALRTVADTLDPPADMAGQDTTGAEAPTGDGGDAEPVPGGESVNDQGEGDAASHATGPVPEHAEDTVPAPPY